MTGRSADGNNLFYLRTGDTVAFIRLFAYPILAIVFITIHLQLSQFAFDDAYIHFRVARNLLELGTPYFNVNEAIKVSTSSGWTVFIAALMALSQFLGLENNFRLVVSLANAGIVIAGMFVYTAVIDKILEKKTGPANKVFFQIIYVALLAGASVGLMEVPLALLFAGLGIHEILKSKLIGFFWLGLSAYIRIELVILLAFVGLYWIFQHRSRILRIFMFTALGILPFLLYDLYFFHTIVPHSIVAKSAVYSITSLQTFIRSLLLAFPINTSHNQFLYFIAGLVFLISIVFSIAVTLLLNRNSPAKTWILIFGLTALAVFIGYVAGHTLIFEWYPPLYTVPALITVTLCANRSLYPRNGISNEIHLILFGLSLVVLVQFSIAAFFDRAQFIQFESGSRVKTYLEVGKILNTEYPDGVLLSSEIGGLGYAFRGTVLDAAGLASSDALEFHPMRIPEQRSRGDLGVIPPFYVAKHMPNLIVSYDQFAQALLASTVVNQYNVILLPAYLPEDRINAKTDTIWGNKYLRIYVRKDLPLSNEILKLGIK